MMLNSSPLPLPTPQDLTMLANRLPTWALAATLAWGGLAQAEMLAGRVVNVHDGDTLTLATGWFSSPVKIRLAQIDAPESDQAYGQPSRESLAGMVMGKQVKVETATIDKDGRIVGTVFADGSDVNREQIRRGMAWAYRQYLRDSSLLYEEEQARQARRGLWAEPNPMPPWVYRHGGKYNAHPPPSATPRPSLFSRLWGGGGACGNKRTCREMDSCDEAKHYLTDCGLSQLDKDKDGVPCESLCGNSR